MGTEYKLFKKDGLEISSYEMSNRFDMSVYPTSDKEAKDLDIHLFEGLTPTDIIKFATNLLRMATYWSGPETKKYLEKIVPGLEKLDPEDYKRYGEID